MKWTNDARQQDTNIYQCYYIKDMFNANVSMKKNCFLTTNTEKALFKTTPVYAYLTD